MRFDVFSPLPLAALSPLLFALVPPFLSASLLSVRRLVVSLRLLVFFALLLRDEPSPPLLVAAVRPPLAAVSPRRPAVSSRPLSVASPRPVRVVSYRPTASDPSLQSRAFPHSPQVPEKNRESAARSEFRSNFYINKARLNFSTFNCR